MFTFNPPNPNKPQKNQTTLDSTDKTNRGRNKENPAEHVQEKTFTEIKSCAGSATHTTNMDIHPSANTPSPDHSSTTHPSADKEDITSSGCRNNSHVTPQFETSSDITPPISDPVVDINMDVSAGSGSGNGSGSGSGCASGSDSGSGQSCEENLGHSTELRGRKKNRKLTVNSKLNSYESFPNSKKCRQACRSITKSSRQKESRRNPKCQDLQNALYVKIALLKKIRRRQAQKSKACDFFSDIMDDSCSMPNTSLESKTHVTRMDMSTTTTDSMDQSSTDINNGSETQSGCDASTPDKIILASAHKSRKNYTKSINQLRDQRRKKRKMLKIRNERNQKIPRYIDTNKRGRNEEKKFTVNANSTITNQIHFYVWNEKKRPFESQ